MRRLVLFLALTLSACRPASADPLDPAPAPAPRPPPPAAGPSPSAAPAPSAQPTPSPGATATPTSSDWCEPGLTPLDDGTCYVLPPLAQDKPRRLLVYLHGITPPLPASPQKHNVQTAVLHAATRAGAAALVPRGLRGVGPEGARDWWAWPTSPAKHAELAPGIVARLRAAKARLESIAGAPFERTFVAGSSNGAYFLSALALGGDLDAQGLPVDGFGAMSGGAAGGLGTGRGRTLPFYVGFGTYDEDTKKNVRSLVSVLEAGRWPHRVAEHPFGHGSREVYLDEAFTFWDGVRAVGSTGAGASDRRTGNVHP